MVNEIAERWFVFVLRSISAARENAEQWTCSEWERSDVTPKTAEPTVSSS